MNFQLRHCSIWSCLGLPCAAFPTRPRALHTLILFYFTFKNFSSTFHFHFLQLLQQLFQPDPAPCTLLSFLLNFPLPQKLLVRLSLYFYYFVLSLIFTTTVLNLYFLSPACLHFDISLSKCIWAHKYDDLRVLSQHFSCYICF